MAHGSAADLSTRWFGFFEENSRLRREQLAAHTKIDNGCRANQTRLGLARTVYSEKLTHEGVWG